MRKNSVKNIRINAEVQRELSHIISQGIKDPRISPMTSVVSVEVAPDFVVISQELIKDSLGYFLRFAMVG